MVVAVEVIFRDIQHGGGIGHAEQDGPLVAVEVDHRKLVEVVSADPGAAQHRQVAADAERGAEVARQRASISRASPWWAT